MCAVLAKLQKSATLATNWYDSNLLQRNLKKYQTISIRNKSVTCGDTEVLKLLGVTIDCGLNFNVHISNVCKKASQRIGVIMRSRNLIPTEAKLHLYQAVIPPHLTYCHLAWHFCRASDTRRLERVQERELRAAFKDKLSSYQELLEKTKLPTVYNRRLQDICTLIYKVKHKQCPTFICNIFNSYSSSYSLRQSDLSISRYNSVTYGKHSLRNLGPKLWSKLSPDVRSINTLNSFKNKIYSCDMASHSFM